ncbi:MAG: hypothetical protein U1E18_05790 [Brevundimonas sp.]|uniref:hypothetical protein n=1 Tax=Brevundimonas sp. TaxID=1871086 RepID=UPI002ABA4B90|nr:hypothetical protein [Brevundimonas sp.]MDZ4109099.1 hypothetical protein [Brevundimonas sp.]
MKLAMGLGVAVAFWSTSALAEDWVITNSDKETIRAIDYDRIDVDGARRTFWEIMFAAKPYADGTRYMITRTTFDCETPGYEFTVNSYTVDGRNSREAEQPAPGAPPRLRVGPARVDVYPGSSSEPYWSLMCNLSLTTDSTERFPSVAQVVAYSIQRFGE